MPSVVVSPEHVLTAHYLVLGASNVQVLPVKGDPKSLLDLSQEQLNALREQHILQPRAALNVQRPAQRQ